MSVEPDRFDRARDELQLMMLNCWEEGWSAGDIAKALNVTRMVPLGVVHRINKADPTALLRKPAPPGRQAA